MVILDRNSEVCAILLMYLLNSRKFINDQHLQFCPGASESVNSWSCHTFHECAYFVRNINHNSLLVTHEQWRTEGRGFGWDSTPRNSEVLTKLS
jgi:hypothetical protein